jgi:hypothetical protein
MAKHLQLDVQASLKAEQREIRNGFQNKFLADLDVVLEKCFMPYKDKKEHFISKERLTVDFLKLLQSQKKFKTTECIQNQLCSLAAFDIEESLIGRITTIDLTKKTVEFITFTTLREHTPNVIKGIEEVDFFDPNSLQMEVFYRRQRLKHDMYDFTACYSFLTSKYESVINNKPNVLTR